MKRERREQDSIPYDFKSSEIAYQTISQSGYIRVSRQVMKILGLEAATLLAEFINESHYLKDSEGWFYATQSKLEDRTTLDRNKQQKIIPILIERGLIEKERRGLPYRNYFRFHGDKYLQMLTESSSIHCTQNEYTSELSHCTQNELNDELRMSTTENSNSVHSYNETYNETEKNEKALCSATSENSSFSSSESKPNQTKSTSVTPFKPNCASIPQNKIDKLLVGQNSIRYWPREFLINKDFESAWSDWLEYRDAKKSPVSKLTRKGFQKDIARVLNEVGNNPNDIVTAINNSMARNWTGIYKGYETKKNINGFNDYRKQRHSFSENYYDEPYSGANFIDASND
jgi:hypothetical protein